MQQSAAILKSLFAFLFATTTITADIHVVDGDTVCADGQVYRLVGFDTPESGEQAQCPSERILAARATTHLQQLVTTGKTRLERVACACRPGTEGTPNCNYGLLCAVLTVDGRDVGELLINEGLAHRYVCGSTGCPRKEPWCDQSN